MRYKLPEGWREVELGDIGKIITGKTPRTKVKENFNGDIPFLTPSDDMENRFVTKTDRTLSKIGLASVKNQAIPKDSICVSCIGSQLGKVTITKQETVTNQQINSIVVNENINNMFIYYCMLLVGDRLRYISKTSTAVPIVNKTNFSKEKIALPPTREQKVIADTLSSLDNKIELNNKINENLEQQAQAIFKHWFVDFEFPDENGNPYKSSGGQMVESELGMIPKGWEVKRIEDFIEVVSKGTTPRKKDVDGATDEKTIKFLKVGNINNNGEIDYLKLDYIPESIHMNQLKRSILEYKDILISIAGTIGRISYVDNELINSNTNQAIAFIRLKNIEKHFLLIINHFKSKMFQDSISSMVVQAVQANISLTVIKDEKIIEPKDNVLSSYNEIMKSNFNKKNINKTQNKKLSQLRDTLLPKLMSGEIRIPLD